MAPTLQQLGIEKLPAEERLAIAEAIWDSVMNEVANSPLSPAQERELERRLADSLARPDAVVGWEQVKAKALARARNAVHNGQ